MCRHINLRKGVAMIELIFAIVILAIVMMSAPTLISTASRSSLVALQQESIAAITGEAGIILTHHWDENDTNGTLTAPILTMSTTSAADAALAEAVSTVDGNLTGRRAGTPNASVRSFITSLGGRLNATPAGSLGSDGNDIDDIDDFDSGGVPVNMFTVVQATTAVDGDYIDAAGMQMQTDVFYINDGLTTGNYANSQTIQFNPQVANAGDTTNIKMIQLRLTTTSTEAELDKNISMHAFSCNIGSYTLEQRVLP